MNLSAASRRLLTSSFAENAKDAFRYADLLQ